MVVIHTELKLGGTETYYLRIAKECRIQKKQFIIILVKESYNKDIYNKLLEENSKIIFYNELLIFNKLLFQLFPTASPLKMDILKNLLSEEKLIYVANTLSLALALRLNNYFNNSFKILVGFHHSMEFIWGYNKPTLIPYYEKMIRNLIFKKMPKENILPYNNTTKNRIEKLLSLNLDNCTIFPYGVTFKKNSNKKIKKNKNIFKIVSIGRLVKFKTYNIWMIDVVKSLIDLGYSVTYDIYGEGEELNNIKKKINNFRLDKIITLKGNFDYSEFGKIIKNYDVLVGSGTTVIEAASFGTPSIIGSESIDYPISYGFLHECYKHDYNLKDLDLNQRPVLSILKNLINTTLNEYLKIVELEIKAANTYSMSKCLLNIESTGKKSDISFNRLIFDISRKIEGIKLKTGIKKNIHLTKYDYIN